ncbi:MAG: hypothetical protein ABFD18_06130 [Syntrophomonas sp.]
MDPIKLILKEDIGRLSKDILNELCDTLEIPEDASPYDLADIIYDEFLSSKEKMGIIYDSLHNVVYAGRRAITWFSLPDEIELINLPEAFEQRFGIKPYDSIIKRNPQSIGKSALVIGACSCGNKNRHLIRFLVGSGATRLPYGGSYNTHPISTLVSTIIDFDEKFIEIRSDPKYNARILREYSILLGLNDKKMIGPIKPIEPYGNRVEELAKKLDGSVFKTDSRPDIILKQQLSEEQVAATASILVAIDEYFEQQDINLLSERLTIGKNTLGSLADLPFSLALLSGLERVGISVNEVDDIKYQPLLVALKPYLESLGGFIRFPVNENGIESYHTIRVGLTTKSVSFRTYASEFAIDKVRKVILNQE